MVSRRAVMLAFLLLLLNVITMSAQVSNDRARLKQGYEAELVRAGVVGSSLVLTDGGRITDEYHYGIGDLRTRRPVDRETIYHWASNTKPLTGIAIMQLRDRGLLKLDDAVTKYLPELRSVHNKFGSMDGVTIRHLMTHSAGFRASTWPWDKGEDWEPFEPKEYSQLVAMFPFTEILFQPGSKFGYSNPGIIFLGRIIEKLSGEDYEVYVDKNILRPLEMHRSYFDATPPHLLEFRSHSYYITNGTRSEGRFDVDTGITVSNSGLNSPVSDMVKYVDLLLGDPKRATTYDRILKRSSLEEMFKSQLPTETDANGNRGFTTHIGLLFFVDETLGKTHLGHGGDQNGFISYIDFDPAKRRASVLVFNTTVNYPAGTPAEQDVVPRLRKLVRAQFR